MSEARAAAGPIDADVHPSLPTPAELSRHLPAVWCEFLARSRFAGSRGFSNAYPPGVPTTRREPAPAGTEAARARLLQAVFDEAGAGVAVLNCYYGLEAIRHPDLAPALAGAINDWLRVEWLDVDPRLRASIAVQAGQPAATAAEIERLASDRRFVQVLLPVRSERPYGNRHYDPLFAAASAADLAVAIHFGGMTGNAPGSVGWPGYYFEEYVGMAAVFQSQVTSLIVEGVFERFPGLRISLVEGGWTWAPSLLWRLDKDWKGLRREAPWLKQKPSEYFRRHFRLTLQPLDCPPRDPGPALEALEQLGGSELLLYSSDYPHRHAVDPEVFLSALGPADRVRVESANAASWYRLAPVATL